MVIDGDIVAAAQEERFTRKKHDSGFPSRAAAYCLESAGLSTEEIDFVVFYDKPFLKFERLFETYLAFAPRGVRSFARSFPVWLKEKLFQKNVIVEALKGLPEPVQVVSRHAPLSLEEVDLDPASGDIATQLQSRFDPRHSRIDLRDAPLWRLFAAQDPPNNRWLLLELMHHFIGDHVTLQALEQEIRTILRGESKRPSLRFPRLSCIVFHFII